MRIAAACFITLLLNGLALAQPQGVTRVLRTFDFEERRLGNVEEIPMHWIKVQGDGLPHYVNGRLSTDTSRSGAYSFRFDLNGGGLIYRYEHGQIPVQPGAHYRVEGFVKTTVLPKARARITACFADIDGRIIESSIRHSVLYAATKEGADWKRLEVEISASDSRAAFLVIELGLLQPMHYSPSLLGERTLFTQDIRGSAWFDDVSVSQVPRVILTSEQAGNIFRRSDPLRLQVLVNDRFTDDLAAQMLIRDAVGRVVFQRSAPLDSTAGQDLGPGQKQLLLPLPQLRPGWYEIDLEMSSQGQPLGQQTVHIVLLADDEPALVPDPRFGISATSLPFEGWEQLPGILPQLGAGRVKLAVWSAQGDVHRVDSAAFDRLLAKLQALNITPTACLVAIPPDLAQKISGDSWLQLLKARSQDWQPQLAYMLARHANHLQRWQFGDDEMAEAFVKTREMRDVYQLLYREFTQLMDRPDLAMPWPAWYEMEGQLPATIALSVPSQVLPSQLPVYMNDLGRRREGHHLSLTLGLLDRGQYGRELQIRDLAQRVIYALSADAYRIDLPLPLTVRRVGETVVSDPQELLIISRTLMSVLGATSYRGKVPLAEGVEAFLFDRGGQSVLALWSNGNETKLHELALNLTEQPMQVDLWGNATPLVREPGHRRSGSIRLSIGPTPTFLLGVDGQLAQLRASIGFDNPLLESSFKPHTRRIRFTNPYPHAIAGSFRLRPPQGWVLNPPTMTFSLNPAETFERELTVEFPYNSFAGAKMVYGDFLVHADGDFSFTVPIEMKLGLSDVGLQTLALRDGDDVIVQQMITNYGDEPIDYSAFAMYPGQARQERLVTNLEPGRTTIRKYRFVNVKFLPDAKVRSGVKELVGTRILNDEAAIQ